MEKQPKKRCSICDEELNLDHFWEDKTRKDGLCNYCKDCGDHLNKSWSDKDREKTYKHEYQGMFLNPTLKYFLDVNPDIGLMKFAWALYWRFSILLFATFFALGIVIGILDSM